jgi:hypothetical protein
VSDATCFHGGKSTPSPAWPNSALRMMRSSSRSRVAALGRRDVQARG